MSHSAFCHDGTRTARDASLTDATPAPTVSRPAPVATPGLAAPGLASSRIPAGTSFPDATLAWRKPRARPSQIPVASAGRDGTGGPRYTSPVLDVVGKGGGRPLDQKVRADMEARLGSDFSDVRIHTGDKAAKSAAGISAMAYTVGNDVVFGRGYFDPASHEGRHRLAHELMHVQQQRQGPVSGTDRGGGMTISDPADSFEREAEATAVRVASGPSLGAPGDLRGHHVGKPSDQLTEGRSVQRCGGMPCDCAADEQDRVQGSAGAPALQRSRATGIGLPVSHLMDLGEQEADRIADAAQSPSAAAAAPPAPAPPSPTIEDCTPTQTGALILHLGTARIWVNDAARKIADYASLFASRRVEGEPKSRATTAVVRSALMDNFHTTEAGDVLDIRDGFASLRTELNSDFTFECEDEDCDDNAYIHGFSFTRRWSNIHVCPPWFKQDYFNRVRTLIHERAHQYPGAHDKAYNWDSSNYATLSPEHAIDNADSYAVAARQIYHGGAHGPGT